MIKCILFDLDGTLVNTLYDLADATNYAITKRGYKAREPEEFKMFAGGGSDVMLRLALGGNTPDEAEFEAICADYLDFYREHYIDKAAEYDGLHELISVLKTQGINLAVVTNKIEEMAVIILNKLFPNSFEYIFGQRKGVPIKPDPTAAIMIMNELQVKPGECIFLGDSGVDMLTAVNSGACPVGVGWGFREREELLENGARYIIDSPDELYQIINQLNTKEKGELSWITI